MSCIGSHIWTVVHQSAALLEGTMASLRGGALLEEVRHWRGSLCWRKYVTGGGALPEEVPHWRWVLQEEVYVAPGSLLHACIWGCEFSISFSCFHAYHLLLCIPGVMDSYSAHLFSPSSFPTCFTINIAIKRGAAALHSKDSSRLILRNIVK